MKNPCSAYRFTDKPELATDAVDLISSQVSHGDRFSRPSFSSRGNWTTGDSADTASGVVPSAPDLSEFFNEYGVHDHHHHRHSQTSASSSYHSPEGGFDCVVLPNPYSATAGLPVVGPKCHLLAPVTPGQPLYLVRETTGRPEALSGSVAAVTSCPVCTKPKVNYAITTCTSGKTKRSSRFGSFV